MYHVSLFYHTLTVGAAITTPLPLNTVIQANHPGNLTCTAVGSKLQFSWYYGDKHFIPSDIRITLHTHTREHTHTHTQTGIM